MPIESWRVRRLSEKLWSKFKGFCRFRVGKGKLMSKVICITGATDGIGKLTASLLASQGHKLLLHGRNATKLETVVSGLDGEPESFVADFSRLEDVEAMAAEILEKHDKIDVLINNAGVFKTSHPRTESGLDVRFVVNTLAPYVLTRRLLPILPIDGRVVNLSSAAQAMVNIDALVGRKTVSDMDAYAQSKLAITIWSQELAKEYPEGPVFVAVNPGSLLASKMVKEGFGVAGNDLHIGAQILCDASLSGSFSGASGMYFDNDAKCFQSPHSAAQHPAHVRSVMEAIETLA
jgi:NAD(P)-dependent dehydrogenase (short-subunit alcohol dehydrogenase family)